MLLNSPGDVYTRPSAPTPSLHSTAAACPASSTVATWTCPSATTCSTSSSTAKVSNFNGNPQTAAICDSESGFCTEEKSRNEGWRFVFHCCLPDFPGSSSETFCHCFSSPRRLNTGPVTSLLSVDADLFLGARSAETQRQWLSPLIGSLESIAPL